MSTWNPVISGVLHRAVESHEIPRKGEYVEFFDDKSYEVVGVVHYVSHRGENGGLIGVPDVHLKPR
ncbi:hypothetical protein [Mycobacteroides abscessus]|uniref:hypothetical protein n=1 Tax=Mycobacteroides abscessus TaxID=36809 RepID=UPI0010573ABE|nr:hypothetical protein [Mycobacteroides abscessus]